MDLPSVIGNFSRKRILVIGDLILDRYIWGKVRRISPEAPVPVVEVTGDTFALGGAANVANNIASLGGHAAVLGVVGKDAGAEVIKELLESNGIECFAVEDKRPTTIKTRVIAHSQQVVRFDQEDKEAIGGKPFKTMASFIEDSLPDYDAVIVSDYKKGVVSAETMNTLLLAASKSGGRKFIAVDPKVGHFHLYKGVSLITPNIQEASEGSGIEITGEKTLLKAGASLLKKLRVEAVLITRGEQGMSLFQRANKNSVVHIPTLAKQVFDVTGAGDTVIATFALSRASGASLENCAVIANHAAGIVVGEVGTAVVTPSKLRQSLKTTRR